VEEAETTGAVEEATDTENAAEAREEENETVEEPEVEERPVEEEISEEAEEEEERTEIVDERIYTIPLGRAWIAPRRKRAPKAVRLVRDFITRHMKVGSEPVEEREADRLVITNAVNEKIWRRGIEKPPRRIRIRAAKDVEGTVTVYLAEGD
jgi:large subunit ribosomal protein L31e